jgi:hypothetical protein
MTKLLKAVCLFAKHASIIVRKTSGVVIKNADVSSSSRLGCTRKNARQVIGK